MRSRKKKEEITERCFISSRDIFSKLSPVLERAIKNFLASLFDSFCLFPREFENLSDEKKKKNYCVQRGIFLFAIALIGLFRPWFFAAAV